MIFRNKREIPNHKSQIINKDERTQINCLSTLSPYRVARPRHRDGRHSPLGFQRCWTRTHAIARARRRHNFVGGALRVDYRLGRWR